MQPSHRWSLGTARVYKTAFGRPCLWLGLPRDSLHPRLGLTASACRPGRSTLRNDAGPSPSAARPRCMLRSLRSRGRAWRLAGRGLRSPPVGPGPGCCVPHAAEGTRVPHWALPMRAHARTRYSLPTILQSSKAVKVLNFWPLFMLYCSML